MRIQPRQQLLDVWESVAPFGPPRLTPTPSPVLLAVPIFDQMTHAVPIPLSRRVRLARSEVASRVWAVRLAVGATDVVGVRVGAVSVAEVGAGEIPGHGC